jgi:hypothetical protein
VRRTAIKCSAEQYLSKPQSGVKSTFKIGRSTYRKENQININSKEKTHSHKPKINNRGNGKWESGRWVSTL